MKRKISLFLAAVMLLSSFGFSASAGWDGYTGTDGGDTAIFKPSNIVEILDTGLVPIAAGVDGGSSNSVYWSHNSSRVQINQLLPIGHYDFSDYTGMYAWIYSAKKTGSQFGFIILKNDGGYFSNFQKINWEGWKKIQLDFSDFGCSNGNVDWSDIKQVDLYGEGWGMVPNPESVLYVNSIFLTGNESTNIDSVKAEDVEKVLKKSVCFYSGINSYLNKNQPVNYSDGLKSIEKGGVCYVPAADLGTALGAELKVADGKVTSGTKELDVTPHYEGETAYLPVDFTAQALGKSVAVNKYLVVVSDKETTESIRRNDRMLEEIAVAVTADHTDYSTITKADMEQVLQNWEDYLTGGSAVDDTNADAKNIKYSVEKNAIAKWETMNKTADAVILWGNTPCAATATMRTQYTNLLAMALGWATPGTSTYHDEQLKKDIMFGLEWGYENLYGEDEINNEGWRDTWSFNWHEWQIGVPMDMGRILLLLRHEVPKDLMLKYLRPLDYFTTEHFGRGTHFLDTKDQGANVADTAYGYMISQLLQGNAENAARALGLVVRDLAYQDVYKGDGPHRDGSYRFHYYYPMNGTYSISYMSAATPLIAVTNGTKFAVSDSRMDLYAEWLLRAYGYSIYNGRIMNVFRGRDPGGEQVVGQQALGWIMELSESFSDSGKAKVQSFIKYFIENGYFSKNGLSIHKMGLFDKIANDDTIKPMESIRGFNMFYNTDKAVWQNDDYALAISMSSSRVSGWESINGANKKGWYLSDGMVYTYNKSDPNSYADAYWQNVNWYHLPGTTVDTQERVAESVWDQKVYLSSQDFVGGAGLNDTYGTAAMILESCHNEILDTYTSTYGNGLPLHNNDLMANKAYFVFDDEMVALGSGINSTMNFDVQTILDNRMSADIQNLNPEMEMIEKYEIKSVEVSDTPEVDNIGPNVIDGDITTRWSAENEQTLKLDLGEVKTVGMVGIAVMHGKTRTTKYDIYLSADGETWTNIFKGESSGKTDEIEIYDGKKTEARYVRFDFHGNSQGSWNSVTEVEVYPPRADGVIGLPRAMNMPNETITVNGNEISYPISGNIETEVITTTDTVTVNEAKWAHIENSGGFVFLEPAKVSSLKTTGSVAFTEMWIDHGKNPVNDTYAYIMLPSRTAAETLDYSNAPHVTVISNTAELQAVRENNINVTGMVFYKAGTCEGVTVDIPCIITMQKIDEAIELSVSDPTMNKALIKLAIAGLEGYEFDSEGSDARVSFENGTVSINVSGADGEAFKVRFVKV